MKIISEITNKEYKTVEECEKAEKEFLEEQALIDTEKDLYYSKLKAIEEKIIEKRAALDDARCAYQDKIKSIQKDYQEIVAKINSEIKELNSERLELWTSYDKKFKSPETSSLQFIDLLNSFFIL